ncbi:sulfotransferase [Nonomuraea sp. NPDC048916]|uniref:sulfotransferase n=1 Tax=Nonomuraea sp. NPDC048916 TaxID=3154232 RepID=UPI0033DBF11F
MTQLITGEQVFGGHLGDPEHALKVLTAQIDEVKASIPPGRLLVYQVTVGWEPLCEFLGTPVPDEPFPQVNDAAEFSRNAQAAVVSLLFRRSG